MAITTRNRDDSSPSTTNQRPYDEVYQTPRFNASHPYRNGQARLAPSRHLWQDDTNCSGVSHLQNLSLSVDLGCQPPIGNAFQRSKTARRGLSPPVCTIHLALALGRHMLASESVLDLKVLPIPAQFRGVSPCMLPQLRCGAAVDPLDDSAHRGGLSER